MPKTDKSLRNTKGILPDTTRAFRAVLAATATFFLPFSFVAQAAPTQESAPTAAVTPRAPSPSAVASAAQRPNLLLLKTGIFDPLSQHLDFSDQGFSRAPSNSRYSIIQFDATRRNIAQEMATSRRILRDQGAEILSYLPGSAYVVRDSHVSAATSYLLPGVRWIGPFEPGFKVSPDLWTTFSPMAAVEPADVEVEVLGFAGVEADELAELVSSANGGPVMTGVELSPRYPTATFLIHGADLSDFLQTTSAMESVYWISRHRAPELATLNSVSPIQANNTTDQPIWDQGLIGTGQIVTVLDTGLDRNQCWFTQWDNGVVVNTDETDADTSVSPPEVGALFPERKVVGYFNMPSASEYDDNQTCGSSSTGFHGTHVAGIVAGDDPTVSSSTPALPGFEAGDGMAPNAQILVQDGGNDSTGCLEMPNDLGPVLIQAREAQSFIHNNSWGSNTAGAYTSRDSATDQQLFETSDILMLVAAGNTSGGAAAGSIFSPGSAKNVTTVGAFGNGNSTVRANYSNRGPTDDNRRKPDIMAPGSNISAASGDDNDTTASCPATVQKSGTSMATPHVSGAAALIRQYFMEGFYPAGTREADDALTPSGMLMKAMLLNGTRMDTSNPGNDTGWGRVFLDNNLYFNGDDRQVRHWDVAHERGVETGDLHSYEIWVPSAGEELRVTLAWFDPGGDPTAALSLVNNLDLEVIDPSGTVFLGNVFTNDSSTVGGAADAVDTVEQVRFTAAGTGLYTLRVRGTDIPGNGGENSERQGYALVVSSAECAGRPSTVPTDLGVSSNDDSGIELSFTPLPAVDLYQFYRAEGGCGEPATSFSYVGDARGAGSFLDAEAEGGATYGYRMRSANSCGEGALSTCVEVTSEACFGPFDPNGPYLLYHEGSGFGGALRRSRSIESGRFLDINWPLDGFDGGACGLQEDDMSLEWRQRFEVSGPGEPTVHFDLLAQGAYSLVIDGYVISHRPDPGDWAERFTLELFPGTHEILLFYVPERKGRVRLTWQPDGETANIDNHVLWARSGVAHSIGSSFQDINNLGEAAGHFRPTSGKWTGILSGMDGAPSRYVFGPTSDHNVYAAGGVNHQGWAGFSATAPSDDIAVIAHIDGADITVHPGTGVRWVRSAHLSEDGSWIYGQALRDDGVDDAFRRPYSGEAGVSITTSHLLGLPTSGAPDDQWNHVYGPLFANHDASVLATTLGYGSGNISVGWVAAYWTAPGTWHVRAGLPTLIRESAEGFAAGKIVGQTAGSQGFLWNTSDNSFITIGASACSGGSSILDINRLGTTVGSCSNGGDAFAFRWSGRAGDPLVNLDATFGDAVWDLTHAYGLNDYGDIVGEGMIDGQSRIWRLVARYGAAVSPAAGSTAAATVTGPGSESSKAAASSSGGSVPPVWDRVDLADPSRLISENREGGWSKTVALGSPLSLDLSAFGAPPLTMSLLNPVSGMSLDDAGHLDWTGPVWPGSHDLDLELSDAGGGTHLKTLELQLPNPDLSTCGASFPMTTPTVTDKVLLCAAVHWRTPGTATASCLAGRNEGATEAQEIQCDGNPDEYHEQIFHLEDYYSDRDFRAFSYDGYGSKCGSWTTVGPGTSPGQPFHTVADVQVSNIASTSATITYKTVMDSSYCEYPISSYAKVRQLPKTPYTTHSGTGVGPLCGPCTRCQTVNLTGLSPSTTYRFILNRGLCGGGAAQQEETLLTTTSVIKPIFK